MKADAGKPAWDLLPYDQLGDVVDVFGFGAQKYSPEGWQSVSSAEPRYFAAAMRHLVAWKGGQHFDQESGLPHLAHAIASLLILAWHDNQGGEL